MNLLSLLSFFTALISLLLGFYVFLVNKKSRINQSLLFLCLSLFIWSFSYTFVYPENDQTTVWFWYRLSSLGWCTLPFFSLLFLVHLSGFSIFDKNVWLTTILFLPAILFVYLCYFQPFLIADLVMGKYGVLEIPSPQFFWRIIFTIYYFIYISLGLFLVARWGINSKIASEKKQALIIGTSGLIVLVFGSLTNLILPLSQKGNVPALAPVLTLIWVLAAWYAVLRYKAMIVTSDIAADEVLQHIVDLVLIVDLDGIVVKTNHSIKNILGIEEKIIIGKNYHELITESDKIEQELKKIFKGSERKILWDLHCRSKNGLQIPFSFYLSSIRNKMGNIIGAILVGQDLRLIKRLEDEIIIREKMESALENANEDLEEKVSQRTKELELYATTDTMTGAYNRRVGLILLEKSIQTVKREKSALTICFIDINDLKKANDQYGHTVGDELIIKVAHILKETIRESDILCRMGGDEFLVILQRCNMEQSLQVWDNIQKKIKENNEKSSSRMPIQISRGFAEYDPQKPVSVDELIVKADEEMYRYKKRTKKIMAAKRS